MHLTPAQDECARPFSAACRAVFNAALEQRRVAYTMTGSSPGWTDQCRDLTEARKVIDWLSDAPAQSLQAALRDLDRAFKAFFAGRSAFPRYRRRTRPPRFRCPQGRDLRVRRLNRRWGEVTIPKIGPCRFRFTRPLGGVVKHATIARDALGWRISFCVETGDKPAPPSRRPPVGVDRGIRVTAALSTAELWRCPTLSKGRAERLQRLRRTAGRQETVRRVEGRRERSHRHQRTLDALARLTAAETHLRHDFLHKLSAHLTKSHGLVAMEKLKTEKMSHSAKGTADRPGRGVIQKSALNRRIRASAWGTLERQVQYKGLRHGCRLDASVPPMYSSAECSYCGSMDPRSRTRGHLQCTVCGYQLHADVNAAPSHSATSAGSP